MSCLCYCDEDDCQNTEEHCTVYNISYDIHKPLREKLGNNPSHICKDCVGWWNDDYTEEEPLIIEDNIFDVVLNPNAVPKDAT